MLRLFAIATLLLTLSACTRMPTEYREPMALPVTASGSVSEKMSVVGSALIGKPMAYVDQDTGLSGEVVVESEYFSANGRLCRRYMEKQSSFATAYPGLGCLSRDGWVDIPVGTFAG